MSHEIDQTVNAQGSAVYAFMPAWHGLGTVLDHAPTAGEALAKAGLDWKVEKQPAYSLTKSGLVLIPSQWSITRTDLDKPLGVVGDDYTILQNSEAFDAMATVLEDNGLVYESAGALREGRSVWLLARSPESFKIVEGDEVVPYVLLSTSHVGKSAVRILGTSVRVVCANTERIALSGSSARGASIRHTANLQDRIKDARGLFSRYKIGVDNFVADAKLMASTPAPPSLTTTVIKKAVDLLIPPTSDADLLSQLVAAPPSAAQVARDERRQKAENAIIANLFNERQAPAKGTVWALHNAITEYIEHQSNGFRGTETAKAENRFESLVYGAKEEIKNEVFTALKTYSQNVV